MPRDTNQSDGPSTLPAPELNPLLNPVLGQHMGRWAEVYFTAPPEKREQAVLELLRVLQGEPEPAGAAPSAFVPESSTRSAEAQAVRVRCPWCGRENPASHRFCGMCGKSVGETATTDRHSDDRHSTDRHSDVHIADLHITDEEIAHNLDRPAFDGTSELRVPALRADLDRQDLDRQDLDRRHLDPRDMDRRDMYSRDLDPRDIPARDLDDEIFHYPPPSHSYGAFLGLALVVALLAVGYFVWRSTYGAQQGHESAQASPAVAATQPEAQPTTSASVPPTSDPVPPTVSKSPESGSASPASPPAAASEGPPENERTGAPSRARKPASAKPARAVAAAEKNPTSYSAAGNGAEELTMAQQYLNGSSGQQPNRAEGAKWLWKSVSKHNPEATLLLADLYLRGEGVGKSCDQARILLDAAARQGIKGAGDKLRHLQAFGCQ